MRRIRCSWLVRFTLALAGVVATSRADDAWQQLKVGMTRGEASAVLGRALLTNQARGFTIQIYDAGAEAVFVHGRLASWTAPVGSRSVAPAFQPWPTHPTVMASPAAAPSRQGANPKRDEKSRHAATLPAYRL